MEAPEIKNELVIHAHHGTIIEISVGTPAAAEWISKCLCYCESYDRVLFEEVKDKLPFSTNLYISECYDFGEVFDFVNNKFTEREHA